MIFDVGAHRGEDTEFYLALGHKVVAVEADPAQAAALSQRFAREIADGSLVVAAKAIAATSGASVTFYANPTNSVWGTTSPEWAERNRRLGADSEPIEVETETTAALVAEFGCPEYLKIDIEGADLVCLEGLRATACRPRYVSIESSKTSWAALVAEFDALEDLGYREFQLVMQGRHDRSNGSFTDISGRRFDHSFAVDGSGPFGPWLGGRWVGRRRALRQYRRVFLWYRVFGDNTLGARVTRRIPLARRLAVPRWYDTHARRVLP